MEPKTSENVDLKWLYFSEKRYKYFKMVSGYFPDLPGYNNIIFNNTYELEIMKQFKKIYQMSLSWNNFVEIIFTWSLTAFSLASSSSLLVVVCSSILFLPTPWKYDWVKTIRMEIEYTWGIMTEGKWQGKNVAIKVANTGNTYRSVR